MYRHGYNDDSLLTPSSQIHSDDLLRRYNGREGPRREKKNLPVLLKFPNDKLENLPKGLLLWNCVLVGWYVDVRYGLRDEVDDDSSVVLFLSFSPEHVKSANPGPIAHETPQIQPRGKLAQPKGME